MKAFIEIPKGQRAYGLDIIRAAAIFFVMYGHAGSFTDPACLRYYNIPRIDGVSVFFVLSGFLIGNILLKHFESANRNLFAFWKRRWLRTLPNYYLILLLNILLVFLQLGTLEGNLAPYFFFVQNFNSPHPAFFPEAWSLSIEEWFYFLAPLSLYIAVFIVGRPVKQSFLSISLFLLVLGPLLRYLRYTEFKEMSHAIVDQYFRKQVLMRIDSIVPGLLAAFAFNYLRSHCLKYKIPLLFAGLFLILLNGGIYVFAPINGSGMYQAVFSYTVLAAGVAMMLPYFSQIRPGNEVLYKLITFTSIISYSLYLLNLPVRNFLLAWLGNQAIAYPLYWILSFLLSSLLYYFYERRFLQLREPLLKDLSPVHHPQQ